MNNHICNTLMTQNKSRIFNNVTKTQQENCNKTY